jgi:ribonuclease PH
MRKIHFQTNYVKHPAGSCLAVYGDTKVICTATIEESVPPFLKGSGSGWVTAEYAMLPGSTGGGRKRRDGVKRDSRSVEISRLVGRALRSAVNLGSLGETSILIDCDVLQADGGTRTAAVSGGWVALYLALQVLAERQGLEGPESYLLGQVAAISVGIVDGGIICDLDYLHDSRAEVDMNVVMRDDKLVEIQGTGEKAVFDRGSLNLMLDASEEGIAQVRAAQKLALGL